jgi:transposase-like protein
VRVSAAEKLELIHLVEGSSLSIRRTLAEIGLARSTFYAWYKRYLEAARLSTPGTSATWKAGRKLSKNARRAGERPGTGFPIESGSR